MGIFTNSIFTLQLSSTVHFKRKQEIRHQIITHDGTISYMFNRKVNFLVMDEGQDYRDSYKGRTADKLAIPIVSLAFIDACIRQHKLVDHQDFLLSGKPSSQSLAKGKIVVPRVSIPKRSRYTAFDLNKIQVWNNNKQGSDKFDSNYNIIKLSLLQDNGINEKERKFAAIELHQERTENLSFRVYSHRKMVKQENILNKNNMKDKDCNNIREYRYCQDLDQAVQLYSYLYHLYTKSPHNLQKCWTTLPINIGSDKANEVMAEFQANVTDRSLSQNVASLIQCLWVEAVGELQSILSTSGNELKTTDLAVAEGILLKLKQSVSESNHDSVTELNKQFYELIPHIDSSVYINSRRLISQKQDLCQLIHDMITVNETSNWQLTGSVNAQYKALSCDIQELNANSDEFNSIKNYILSSLKENDSTTVNIKYIYSVARKVENKLFTHEMGNKKLLFHASQVKNYVGILSRGLLLPKIVVSEYGGERSDSGNLGSGIYFADSCSTSLQYCNINKNNGTRMMLVCEVALGKSKIYRDQHLELTSPPSGYDSVHGIASSENDLSYFTNNEYVIYNSKQQKLRYLIEFSLSKDPTKKIKSTTGLTGHEFIPSPLFLNGSVQIDVNELQNNQLNKLTEAGLKTSNSETLPLTDVHFRVKLLDLASEVVVLQRYYNNSNNSIEAKYVFPLDERAAVCGFEAFINNKHIVGQVKEKERAHKEYKEAVSRGDGAYLMDEDSPDVFTVSVGNLPAKANVVIKITYVTELAIEDEYLDFFLPSNLAPWKTGAALSNKTQDTVGVVKIDEAKAIDASIQVSVEMPFEIRAIMSPTHNIKQKCTATRAVVDTGKITSFDKGFRLLIRLAEIHVPRMWAETHPEKGSQACMLTFYPEFETVETKEPEIILVLDMSNSMKDCLLDVKKLALLLLNNLPSNCLFNIAVFGTSHNELFPCSQQVAKDTINIAQQFIMTLSATWGDSQFFNILDNYHHIAKGLKSNGAYNLFVISDGHFPAENSIIDITRKEINCLRIFTFSIGNVCNRYFMRLLAKVGAGYHEHFDSNLKSKWNSKIKKQIEKAFQPTLTSVNVNWQQFGQSYQSNMQAPADIVALFNGSRQVIYGFIPNCLQATLEAEIGGTQISTVVSTSELSKTSGKILHQLTARALIRDYDEGAYNNDRTNHEALKIDQKSAIIELSKDYSIVSPFTSFVAIEDRTQELDYESEVFNLDKLLKAENVDYLPYVSWSGDSSLAESQEMPSTVCPIITETQEGLGLDYALDGVDGDYEMDTDNFVQEEADEEKYCPDFFYDFAMDLCVSEYDENKRSNFVSYDGNAEEREYISTAEELCKFNEPACLDLMDSNSLEIGSKAMSMSSDNCNEDFSVTAKLPHRRRELRGKELLADKDSRPHGSSKIEAEKYLPKFASLSSKMLKSIEDSKPTEDSKKRRRRKVMDQSSDSVASKSLFGGTESAGYCFGADTLNEDSTIFKGLLRSAQPSGLSFGGRAAGSAYESLPERTESFGFSSGSGIFIKATNLAKPLTASDDSGPAVPNILKKRGWRPDFATCAANLAAAPLEHSEYPLLPPSLPSNRLLTSDDQVGVKKKMLSPKSISMFAKSQQNSTAFPVEKEVLRDSRRSDDVNIGSELYSASTVFLSLPPATAALNRTRGQKSTAFRRSRVLAKALIDEVDGQDKPPTALHFGSIDQMDEFSPSQEAHFVGDYSPTSPSAEGKWTIDLPKSPEPNYEQIKNLQSKEGYWDLTDEIADVINTTKDYLRSVLQSCGIQSFGLAAYNDIVRMVITMLIIVMFKDISTLTESVHRGKKWFTGMDKRYPSLLHRMELRQNWESAKLKLIGKA